ncbi:ATP-binding protein [Mucilaginibacter terrae]|uniref:histidine kinase n=1 Tax=Mucilaginibacter terrae TaxID=1955052 RepID=A0ABU3GV16_9SPHI|nr:ATP-binding protein [Mucilaginibacter terrae]MDT3403614.1 two-component system sensor histidine kinase VicK [Mucilaginibacter terrae]
MLSSTTSLSNDELLQVLSLSKDATAIYTGHDIKILFANDAMLAFWGKDRSIIGQSLIKAVPELEGQPFFKMLQDVYTTGVTYADVLPAQTLRDGTLQTRYYDFEYRAIKNAEGKTYCILHAASDVTEVVLGKEAMERAREQQEALEREQALNEELMSSIEELTSTNEELQLTQQELNRLNFELEDRVATRTADLQESEARFRAMAESSGILIAVGDESSNATYFSNAWTDFTGAKPEDLLAFGWANYIHPDDRERYVNNYLSAFKTQEPFSGEFRVSDTSGSHHWMLAKAHPRYKPDGAFAGYICTCVDITEQKELEQRKDDFITIASHELKTPLTSLKVSLQLMDKIKHDPSNAMMPKLIMQARKSIQRVSALVDDLLSTRKLQQGQIQLNKAKFILSQLLNSCANPIAITGSHKISITGNLELEIFADEHQVDQVITNLLSNAVKYAPHSGEIRLEIQDSEGMVKVSVVDKGPGIAPDKIPHLFERYFRVDESGFHATGLGLGLYISAEIIKRHGGEIGVISELGSGSTFWFTLPLGVD